MKFRIVLRALGAAAFMLSFCVANAVAAPAPSPSPSPSATPRTIEHVVTSDRGVEAASRTARTTYVVTAAQIARNGDRTIADALEGVPGVNIVRYGGFGSDVAVGIRGSSSEQVLVLMDGLPIAGDQIDGINLEQLGVAGVTRVEVVEGGGSTLYGSRSIGGVINIVTSAPSLRSTATLSTGSFGEQTYALQTPYFSFQRSYATNDYGVLGAANRQNAQAGLTSFDARYAHRVGTIDLTFGGDLANAKVGDPGEMDFFSPTSEQASVSRDLRLKAQHKGNRATVTASLGVSSQNLAYTCNTPVDASCPNAYPTPPPPALANAPYAEGLYDQRWMASLRDEIDDPRQRIVYGIDLARGMARVDGGTPATPNGADAIASITPNAEAAAYIQSQWYARSGDEFYTGLRGERDGGLGGAYSPSLGGILHLTSSVELKVNAGTAFRAPSAEDLYYPGYSNPNLVAERTQVGDATFVLPTLLGGADVSWYTTAGSNLIVSYPPSYIPENVGHALIQGLSFDVRTRPLHGYRASLDLTDLYRAQNLDTNTRLPGRGAVFAAALGLSYVAPARARFDGFGVTVTSRGPQEASDPYLPSSDAAYQPAAYTTLDAYAGVRLAPTLVLALRGYNLGNERYAIYAGFPMPGRAFALELRTR